MKASYLFADRSGHLLTHCKATLIKLRPSTAEFRLMRLAEVRELDAKLPREP